MKHVTVRVAFRWWVLKGRLAGGVLLNPTNSQVPFTLQKKLVRDPLKSGADQLFTWVTIRWGLWLKSAIVHMCKTAVKCGRLTWRRWHGTKMHLHCTFEQQKGSELIFCGFEAIAAYGPKTRKNWVWIYFMKIWYGRFTQQKYLVHTNFFMGLDPFFALV